MMIANRFQVTKFHIPFLFQKRNYFFKIGIKFGIFFSNLFLKCFKRILLICFLKKKEVKN